MRLTTLQSVHKPIDYNTQSVFDLEWDELAQVLLYCRNVKIKENAGLFNLIAFKDINDPTVQLGRERNIEIPNTVRRCRDNAIAYHGLCLDYDGNATIAQVQERLDGLEYVIYTTFNHTPQNERFRVVIPFSNPISIADFEARKLDIIDTFEGIDPASLSTSQCFYFHSGAHPYTHWNKGVMLDPHGFRVIKKELIADPYMDDEYDSVFIEQLLTRVKTRYPDLKNEYVLWRSIAWATCSVVGKVEALRLMHQFWPTKTMRHKSTIEHYSPHEYGYTVGTLIKLGESKEHMSLLRLQFNTRHNKPTVISVSDLKNRLRYFKRKKA